MSGPSYQDPERYAELAGFRSEWREQFWRDDFLELMVRRLAPAGSAQVLDLGCGVGHWGLRLLTKLPGQARLCGLDREQGFMEGAAQRAAGWGLADRARFVVGEMEELPFEESSFDLVTSQLALIHVRNPERVLREAKRVLKPGGKVLFAEPDNQAGNYALINGATDLDDEQVLELIALQRICERGKRALGEGDDSIGGRLAGMLARDGFVDLDVANNERCLHLEPPYEAPHMKIVLEQELAWARQGISILFGARDDAKRRYLAGGGRAGEFARRYEAVERWLAEFCQRVEDGRFSAARGFLLYLTSATKPSS